MTAEIAIVNRTGIALAADSALTIGRDRVWKNSNKLFHLAPCADVGVMVFGNGNHCGLPWEVIIKQYRKYLGKRTFPNLKDYANNFLEYLDGLDTPHPIQNDLNTYTIMMSIIEDSIEVLEKTSGKTAKRRKFVAEMDSIVEDVSEAPVVFDGYSRQQFSSEHSEQIRGFLEEKLDIMITKPVLSAMITACYEISKRTIQSGAETGVVFAGFGENELLPVVQEICVDGTLDGSTRAWTTRIRDTNESDSGGVVMPFAQSDIAYLFIEGLLPEYIDFMAQTLKGTLDRKSRELVKDYVSDADEKVVEEAKQIRVNEAMTKEFLEQFSAFRRETFVQPMMRVVSSLPKEEMAAVAEALVETTSLRRKMDSRLETVGGPVDVAIISKSDGFVWIKRKHYFDIDLNRDFVQRRDVRYSGEQTDDS